ncbi:peptidoglycan recognition protein family protein [Nocardioides pyridinolyticus]
MVAFTWSDQDQPPAARIRARRGGSWTPWMLVPADLDVPDGEDVGGNRVRGTDLMWIGRADGVQIRIDGRRPSDLVLVLLYPEPRLKDDLLEGPAGRAVAPRSTDDARVPCPELVTRKDWGANESLRDGDPTYNHTLKQVHIHHTVNANDYSRRDVPALIRGMYAYHTQTLGWSDIGYNFLVDRFGRAFVGRAGGPRRLVRGAHTLGFNAESTGVSAIGNYETAQPTDAMLNAIAGIAAWKLDRFDRDPRSTVRVESEGSDKYPAGRTVRLPVIDGHRDTNDTACPGRHLYEALPKIRRRTARRIEAAHQRPIVVERPAEITGIASLGEALRIEPGIYQPEEATPTYQWLRGAEPISGEVDQTYLLRAKDVGSTVGCAMTLTQPGVDAVVQRPTLSAAVTARPALDVVSTARRRVVRVAVSVVAPTGVTASPEGQVTVTVGERTRTVELTDGRADVQFGRRRRMALGKHAVRIVYGGSATFLAADWSGSVRVD